MSKPIISAKNIKKSFGQTHALRGVSLDVEAGEVLAIMGPSGSDKSTLTVYFCLLLFLRLQQSQG